MKTKKLTALALAIIMVFSFAACKKNDDEYSYYSDVIVVKKDNAKGDDTDNTSNTNSQKSKKKSNKGTSSKKVLNGVEDGIVKNTYKTDLKPTNSCFDANYVIKYGNKAVDENLDFGGKVITMATAGGCTTTYMRMVKAFEKKYNCVIKITDLNYSTYITQLAAAVAANKAFDICGMQGNHFPTEAIKGLIEPLENAITTADLYDPSNPSLHAVDFDYSQLTSWQNHMYGVVGHGAAVSQPNLLYYNKKLFKENGLKDPLELYNAKQWTWDTIKSMAKQVSDSSAGVYFLDGECYPAVIQSNLCEWVVYKGNTAIENLTATRNVNALKLMKELFSGDNPAMGPRAFTDNTTNFYAGKSFMYFQSYVYGQQYIRPAIQDGTAVAFNKNVANMGIVPIPSGPDNNDGTYQTGALDYITCGKGRDTLPAIVWAKFKSSYNSSSSSDKNAYTSDEWALIESLANGKTYVDKNFGFSTTGTSSSAIITNIEASIADGADISSTLQSYRSQLQACIDTTLKQQ